MTPPPEVWCAIPVYNNAATVQDIAVRARAHCRNVLVIDDGSTDADVAQLLGASVAPVSPRLEEERFFCGDAENRSSSSRGETRDSDVPTGITVVRHSANLGKGAALLTAMRYAHERGATHLITLDADGQHFSEDIPRFLPHLRPDTILLGRRADITGDMPASSRFGREFSDFWIHLESGGKVLDSQSGFRAYPLPASLGLNVRSLRYGFEVEILTRALWSGLNVATVPIRVYYPPREKRISSFHPLRDNARLTLLHSRLVARQLLPIPHHQIPIQIHRRAAENAEKTQTGDSPGFPPLPSGEASGTGDCPRAGWGEGEFRAPFARHRASPFNIALTAAVTTFFSIVLYPWGFIPVLYLALRLHLSKITAFLFLLLCLPSFIATVTHRISHAVLHWNSHPQLERFIGSHVIAFPACFAAAAIAYTVARKLYGRPDA